MEKSHVSMEAQVCVVCGKQFDTGAILLDKRLRKSMEPHTVTGMGLCPEHKKLKDEGYVALVEADQATNTRLGRVAHLRASVWPHVMNVPVPEGMVAFIDKEGMDKIEAMQPKAADAEGGGA